LVAQASSLCACTGKMPVPARTFRNTVMLYFGLGIMLIGLVVLVAPISVRYESEAGWFMVNWLGLTKTKRLDGRQPARLGNIIAGARKSPNLAVIRRLWHKRDLCRELIRWAGGLVLEVMRTLTFRDSAVGLSLPDPMWNGLLYAVVTHIHLKNVDLSVNFANRNYARIQVTVYPYRVARKLAVFLLHLPYLRLGRLAWDVKKARQNRRR
jgi:hypothetical protein